MNKQLALGGFGLLIIALLLGSGMTKLAGAPNGAAGFVATSSRQTVSTSAIKLVATSSCAARIISTSQEGILLTFRDDDIPVVGSTMYGHWQPASSTVAYDGQIYGCGAIRAISNAATIVSIDDVR